MTDIHAPADASVHGGHSSGRRRRFLLMLIGPVTALTTAGTLVLGAGAPAQAADPDPVGGLLHDTAKTVRHTVHHVTRHRAHHGSSSTGTAGSASSYVVHAQAGKHPVADVSRGSSDVDRDGGARADSTLVGVGGHKLVGSRADSTGKQRGHGPLPENLLCASSGGWVCLDLLFADSAADQSASGSDAATRTGVADLCLAGEEETTTDCDGALQAALLTGTTRVHHDAATGGTRSTADSTGAAVCLREPGSDPCRVDARALTSHQEATSDGTREGGSEVAGAGLDGDDLVSLADPFSVAVAGECVDDSVLCVDGNSAADASGDQVGNGSGDGSGGQDAVQIGGLIGQVGTGLADSSTSAAEQRVDAPQTPADPTNPTTSTSPTKITKVTAAGPQRPLSVDDAVLPHTGGVPADLIPLGLVLLGAGGIAFASARVQRRRNVNLLGKE